MFEHLEQNNCSWCVFIYLAARPSFAGTTVADMGCPVEPHSNCPFMESYYLVGPEIKQPPWEHGRRWLQKMRPHPLNVEIQQRFWVLSDIIEPLDYWTWAIRWIGFNICFSILALFYPCFKITGDRVQLVCFKPHVHA